MNQKSDNYSGLSLIWLLIMFGWFLDVLTSHLGTSMGIQEGSPLFAWFPSMWLFLSLGFSTFVYFFKAAPLKLRKVILLLIVLQSYVPMLRNLVVIYSWVST